MKTPTCSRCHRPLKDPYSIAVGMGPECRGGLAKKGWKFPKPRYQVRDGRVVFLGMTGKVEPPAVNVEALPKKSNFKGRKSEVRDEAHDEPEG